MGASATHLLQGVFWIAIDPSLVLTPLFALGRDNG